MRGSSFLFCLFFFNDTATTEIYTLSLHDALPISSRVSGSSSTRIGSRPCNSGSRSDGFERWKAPDAMRSEEHTSELQSHLNLVCRLLLEKKKMQMQHYMIPSYEALRCHT